jgi:hypothetical protein
MKIVPRRALRAAGLMLMAFAIAHCGGSDVTVVGSGNIDPKAGTFVGTTSNGGVLTIVVGSVDSIVLLCNGQTFGGSCSPPVPVEGSNATGTCSGVTFDVTFTSNDDVDVNDVSAGTSCDGSGSASRTPETVLTMTPVIGETPTPTTTPGASGPTQTPTETGPTATPSGGCPDFVEFTADSQNPATKLDPGWTGIAHDAGVISDSKVTVAVTSCQNASPPCGRCSLTGPVANQGGLNNQRCSNDLSTTCTSNGDCSGGTCKFYLGSLLPLSSGGVSTCVVNEVVGSISGTGNVETGQGTSTINLTSRVFLESDTAAPCPKCEGDTTANDGVRGGTCSKGARMGMPCDVNGTSTVPSFGSTSLDCPFSGASIADLPITLALTTGTASQTLSADSPDCTADPTRKCRCDTCTTVQAQPCSKNSDCPSGANCGGKRCLPPSTNVGAPCTAQSDCTNGVCAGLGNPTQPNACLDKVCTNGVCDAGPFDTQCSIESFRGCLANSECPAAGDFCTTKTRPCFDNGMVGDTLTAQGQADPPDENGESDPTLGAVFCIAPTSKSSVNATAGLPGPGRVILQGHARNFVAP